LLEKLVYATNMRARAFDKRDEEAQVKFNWAFLILSFLFLCVTLVVTLFRVLFRMMAIRDVNRRHRESRAANLTSKMNPRDQRPVASELASARFILNLSH